MFNGKEQENYQLSGRRLEVNFPIVRHFDSFKREAAVYFFPHSGSLFPVPSFGNNSVTALIAFTNSTMYCNCSLHC